jgi:hypothetical protein
LQRLAKHLSSARSFLNQYQPNTRAHQLKWGPYHQKPDVLNSGLTKAYSTEVNPFFHLLLIVKDNRFNVELEDFKDLGALRSMLYCDDVEAGGQRMSNQDGDESVGGLHRKWGLDQGGIVVCRPDGYVGCVVGLEDFAALETYFQGFLTSTASVHTFANARI